MIEELSEADARNQIETNLFGALLGDAGRSTVPARAGAAATSFRCPRSAASPLSRWWAFTTRPSAAPLEIAEKELRVAAGELARVAGRGGARAGRLRIPAVPRAPAKSGHALMPRMASGRVASRAAQRRAAAMLV
jgi:hypothetical protein